MSLSRFKGCLVGAVVADCFGSLFECRPVCRLNEIVGMVERKFERPRVLQKQAGTRPASEYALAFTDDTAMARSVAASLIDNNAFNAKDMATRFAKEYEAEPGRGYGASVGAVFLALLEPGLDDVYKPAAAQFDGMGSYGNGGAMRIAPAPLFSYFDDAQSLQDLVSSITRLTHSHPDAINGAILEALAVDQALRLPQGSLLDADEFLDSLIARMKEVEQQNDDQEPLAKKKKEDSRLDVGGGTLPSYSSKLMKIKDFIKKDDLEVEEVVKFLGNDVSALGSVPAAIFSFLTAATKSQPGIEGRNKFEQTVLYAISLGGDTDTIATMAAAIAGALYGIDLIPESWQYYSEGVADAETFAEGLYQRGSKVTGDTSSMPLS